MQDGARKLAIKMRDAALHRLLLAKRWILAVSVALTGALVGLAANAFPGKTVKTAAAGANTGASGSSEGTSSEGSLTPPEQAPQGSEGEPSSGESSAVPPAGEAPVVSGGS